MRVKIKGQDLRSRIAKYFERGIWGWLTWPEMKARFPRELESFRFRVKVDIFELYVT